MKDGRKVEMKPGRLGPTVVGSLLLLGPAQAQNVESQYGTTSPAGNVQDLSSGEFANRVNERIGDYG